MRIIAAFLFALLFSAPVCSVAGEFSDKGGTIAVDFPGGWTPAKSDDPSVTLRLEKGKYFAEFSRQESELGDYYLKARVKEQVNSLRSKGTTLSGDVLSVNVRGKTTAYYTSYESMGAQAYIAFFTYNSASYAISASGMSDSQFRGMVYSLRKPGEKIVRPKPKKPKRVVRRVRREAPKKETSEEIIASALKEEAPEVEASTAAAGAEPSTAAVVDAGVSTAAIAGAANEAAKDFLTELAKKKEADKGEPPYIPRSPLPILLWGGLIAFWVVGSFSARSAAAAYQNPRLPPPPAEVPPDFFFPFLVTRFVSTKEVLYQVITRQRQKLQAEYASEHEVFIAGGIYGGIFFHVAWSLLSAIGKGSLITDVLLGVPLIGRALASFPEIFFVIPVAIGVYKYSNASPAMQLLDGQSNLVMEVKPEVAYGLIRDSGGKEVARLVRKGGSMDRSWEFVDTDNLVVFTIRDDFPKGYLLRKLFGNLGGALRSRYGIFAQDRRAGFVFLDPSSPDRFQIHMDFAFARLGHPAQILAAVLYIVTREKDPVYPSPF